ncbi:helix-turn-helix transcriptional regulator [Mycolicibacter minnesotensis]
MPDQSGPRRRTSRGQRSPRNHQRERVLDLVTAAPEPVDAAEIAQQMRLHVTTVRFHLDILCDDGSVARTRISTGGVGRPRTGYVAVRDRLDYRGLAEILALELGDTADERQTRAERAGRHWADRIRADRIRADDACQDLPAAAGSTPRAAFEGCTEQILRIFDRMGFDPELTAAAPEGGDQVHRTIRLHACPIQELARSHPEVGCAMHLGLLRGLLQTGDGPVGSAELAPFAEPEFCLIKLTSH